MLWKYDCWRCKNYQPLQSVTTHNPPMGQVPKPFCLQTTSVRYLDRLPNKGRILPASSSTLAAQNGPKTKRQLQHQRRICTCAVCLGNFQRSVYYSWFCKASPLCNHKCRWGDRQYCRPSPVSCPGNPMTTLAHRVIVIHSAKWVGPKLPSSNITLPCKRKRKACYAPHTRPTVCKVSISGLLRTLFG